jgi:hypothetical protein
MQRFSNDHDFEMELGPVDLNCRRKPIDTVYDHWALHLLMSGLPGAIVGLMSAVLLSKIGIIEAGPPSIRAALWYLIPLMWIASFAASMVIRRNRWQRKVCTRHRQGLRWDGRAYRDDEIAGLLPFGVPGTIRSTFPWLSRLFSILEPLGGAAQRANDRASVTLVLTEGRQHVLFCPWKYFEDQDLAALLAGLRAQHPGWFPAEHWR